MYRYEVTLVSRLSMETAWVNGWLVTQFVSVSRKVLQ